MAMPPRSDAASSASALVRVVTRIQWHRGRAPDMFDNHAQRRAFVHPECGAISMAIAPSTTCSVPRRV